MRLSEPLPATATDHAVTVPPVAAPTASPNNVAQPAPGPAASVPAVPSAQTKPTQAWVVQVGSFSNETHAQTLIQRLRAAGFDAYVRKEQHQGKKLTRLFVGPFVRENRLFQAQADLKQKFHLSGIIVTYTELELEK
jgi:DedD protein